MHDRQSHQVNLGRRRGSHQLQVPLSLNGNKCSYAYVSNRSLRAAGKDMRSLPGIFAIAMTLAMTACSEEQAEAPAAPPAKTETAPPAAAPDPTPAENAGSTNDGADAQAEPFFAQMVLGDVTFQVESPNDSSINQVTVRAEGPEDR
jgi:hypothetical protein